MMEHNHAPEWMGEIRRGKVLREVVAGAVVTDSDGNVVNVAAVRPDGTIDETVEAPAAPAKKAPAKKAPAKKAAPKKDAEAEADAPAEEAKPAKKAPAKKAPAKKKAEEAPAEEA